MANLTSAARALLTDLIDYAGMFPPASLNLNAAIDQFLKHRAGPERILSSRFICPLGKLADAWPLMEARLKEAGAWTIVGLGKNAADMEIGEAMDAWNSEARIARAALDTANGGLRLAALEMRIPNSAMTLPQPMWPEFFAELADTFRDALGPWLAPGTVVGIETLPPTDVAGVNLTCALIACLAREMTNTDLRFAVKLRTGGTDPRAFPGMLEMSSLLYVAADHGVPLKLTAGLHQPFPHTPKKPPARHHGFLNLLLASAMLIEDKPNMDDVLEMMDRPLTKDDLDEFIGLGVGSDDDSLMTEILANVRENGILSFGSCSIAEPWEALQKVEMLYEGAEGTSTRNVREAEATGPTTTWLDVPPTHEFSMANLPFGVIRHYNQNPENRIAVAIGDMAFDLAAVTRMGLMDRLGDETRASLLKPTLNDLFAQGNETVEAVRHQVRALLSSDGQGEIRHLINRLFARKGMFSSRLPIAVGDYTDFYSSEQHARNVGTMFRGADNALMPNWKHVPIGYHGRAGTIVVSGTPIVRPWGQLKLDGSDMPIFGPSRRLDIELELAFVIGQESRHGCPVGIATANDHIAGFALFNDWSARDIQQWEYVPLGPFLGKSFASTMSPWIVTTEALKPFRVHGVPQSPDPLPYLRTHAPSFYDIQLEVSLATATISEPHVISRTNAKELYWSSVQQLAHQTSNGCHVRTGDVLASGTISGPEPSGFGSLLELAWRGTKPIELPNGERRSFLQDGDAITLRGWADGKDGRVGFGECRGTILPARNPDAHPSEGELLMEELGFS